MNERIKELEKQSYVDADQGDGVYQRFCREKFAELIQKDMIKQCRDMFIVGSVSWNLLNEKYELFGVE